MNPCIRSGELEARTTVQRDNDRRLLGPPLKAAISSVAKKADAAFKMSFARRNSRFSLAS